MNLFDYNPDTGKIKYNMTVGELMFFDIIKSIKNEKDLRIVALNLCENLETAVHDWYEEHDIKDSYSHFQTNPFFDLEEQT